MIALIQSKSVTNVGGTSHPVTLDAAPTPGTLLVAVFRVTALKATVTGDTGFVVTPAADDDDLGVFSVGIWAKTAGVGESATITFATSGSVASAFQVFEFPGLLSATADKTAGNDPVGTGTTCSTGSTGVLSQPSELAVAAVAINGTAGGGISWDSNFIDLSALSGLITGYSVVSATTALNPIASWTTTRQRTAVIATFKASMALPFAPPTIRRNLLRSAR